jgi:hypothetical protein
MLQHPRAVLLDERAIQIRRQMPLVLRQQRAFHPLDDLLGSGEDVGIDV